MDAGKSIGPRTSEVRGEQGLVSLRASLVADPQFPRTAPVVFQIIDAPSSKRLGILLLVSIAAFVVRGCLRPRRGINSDL